MTASSLCGAVLAIVLACFAVAAAAQATAPGTAAWETGTVKMHFPPGWEPHRAFGERGAGQPGRCKVGYFKSYAGAYPCKPCSLGTFAPEEGGIECHPCSFLGAVVASDGSVFCPKELANEPYEPKGRSWGAVFQQVPNLMDYMMCLLSNATNCQHDAPRPLPGVLPAAAPGPDAMADEGAMMPGPAPAPAPDVLAPEDAAAFASEAPAPSPEALNRGNRVTAPLLPVIPFATAGPEGATAAPEGATAAPEGVTAAPEGATAAQEGVMVPGNAANSAAAAPGSDGMSALAAAGAPLADAGGPLPASEFQTKPVTAIAPEVLMPREAELRQAAVIPAKPAACQSEDSGSQRCGIPIGYEDNGRTGTVFFPANYHNRSLPYMLLLHGSGWTGSDMINEFKDYAIKYDHAIIAPDSHNAIFWSSPDTAEDPYTTDWYHIQACWDAVMNMPGVKVNPAFLTAFGNSRASYTAVAFASRSTTNFNSAGILHASALPQQMGPRAFPILWVTGANDPLYGPTAAKPDVENFRLKRPDFPIKWEIWIDNHTIRNYTQIEAMVTWWLRPATRGRFIQTY